MSNAKEHDLLLSKSSVENIFTELGFVMSPKNEEDYKLEMPLRKMFPQQKDESLLNYHKRLELVWNEAWNRQVQKLPKNLPCKNNEFLKFESLASMEVLTSAVSAPTHTKCEDDNADIFLENSQELLDSIGVRTEQHQELLLKMYASYIEKRKNKWLLLLRSSISDEESVNNFRIYYGMGPPISLTKIQSSLCPTETLKFNLNSQTLCGDYEIIKNKETSKQRISLRNLNEYTLQVWNMIIDNNSDMSNFSSNLKKSLRNSFWKSLVYFYLKSFGYELMTVHDLSKQLKSTKEKREILQDLLECYENCGVSEQTIEAMLNPSSLFYEKNPETGEMHEFVSNYVIVKLSSVEKSRKKSVCAAIWTKNWNDSKESFVFNVVANAQGNFTFPYDTADAKEIRKKMRYSLYMRASGYTKESSDEIKAQLYPMLKFLSIAEASRYPFYGIISRLPHLDMLMLRKECQTFGLQRTFPSNLLHKKDTEGQQIFNTSELNGQFSLKLQKAQTADGAKRAIELMEEFSGEKIFFKGLENESDFIKQWNLFCDEPYNNNDKNKEKPNLKVFFTARIFPSPNQLFGMFIMASNLEKEKNDVLFPKEEKDLNGGWIFGGAKQKKNKTHCVANPENDDDGMLTWIEKNAKKMSINDVM
jgi:hypothetical protein